jgi:hypothetical protein
MRAQAIHSKVAMITFNLACYASVTGRMEEAKERLRHAIDLDKDHPPIWSEWLRGLARMGDNR